MADKPWGGRFKSETDQLMLEFSESVSFDFRLAEVDIRGSMAHARMLGACGIISVQDSKRLIKALSGLLKQTRAEALPLSLELEDVHMNIEARLRDKVGALAGKLHTARSRNDQVALDMRLYFRDRADQVMAFLTGLCRALLLQAENNRTAVMPGFTHTRKAQPVLFAHHLLAYVEMLMRDRERFFDCRRRMNQCPLGSGALAGTTFKIDRAMVAKELGFDGVTQNSIDAVSDRDFLLEFAAAASITMVHLSRLMEELIWWGLEEIGFIDLEESLCTGSSMMPNKKNPDAAELIRGKSGRVIGSLVSLLTIMKGAPLSYNRDFQEDKPAMFDLADTLARCLPLAARLVVGMKVNPEKMKSSCATGFLLATDLADYLATKGLPFREAHKLVGKMIVYCEDKGKSLEELTSAELKSFSKLFDREVKGWLSLEKSVARRNIVGGTSPRQVEKQIRRLKKILGRD